MTGTRGGGRTTADAGPVLARWLRRGCVALGAAMVLVLPQFTARTTFLFGVQGLPGPMAILGAGLALWLMPVLLVASWVAEGRVRMPRPALAVPAALVVVGAAVSTAVAADKASALVRAAEVSGLWVGAWALAQAARRPGERRFLAAAVVTVGAVVAAVAIHQHLVGLPEAYRFFEAHREEILARQGIEPGSWREAVYRERFFGGVQAAVGHPNVLASLLVLATFLALGLAQEKWAEAGGRGARALAAVPTLAAGLSAVGIVLTQSRAAMAAVALGAWWWLVAGRVRRWRRRLVLWLLPLAVGATVLAAAWAADGAAVESALTTLRYRLDYWRATLAVLAEHWHTGVGLENFGHHYVEHKVAESPEEVADPHNMLLSVWSTLGLAGAVGLVLLWATAVRAWWGRRVPGPGGGGPGPAILGLPGLLVPTMAVAAAPVALAFLMGPAWGAAAAVGMMLGLGLLTAEDPRRLGPPDRPLGGLWTAAVVGLVALALAEQIGTAILAPQAAWAMMVALVVSLDPGGALNGAGGGETVAGEKPRLEPATGSRPQQEAAEPEKIHGKAPGRPPPSGPTVRDAASGPPPAAGAGGVDRPLGRPGRFLLMLAAMGLVFGYARGLLVPFAQEGRLLREAAALLDASSAAPVIRAAAEVQPLAWEPAYFEAYLWHQAAQGTEGPGAALALERAVRAYREALARHPRLRRAYLAMAECLLATPGAGRGRLAEARAALEQAARLYPTHLPTRLRLARVIDRLGRRREALEAYREVLRLDALARPQGRGLSAEERAEVAARVAALEAAGDGNRGAAARPAAPQTGWTRTARTW